LACPDCDLLQNIPELRREQGELRARLRLHVATGVRIPIDLPLALTATAAIALIRAKYDTANGTVGRWAARQARRSSTARTRCAMQAKQITGLIVAFCA